MNRRRLLMIDKLVNNNKINHFQDTPSTGHHHKHQNDCRKYPWNGCFGFSISFMLLIIIIVIYLAIFECFIMHTGVMASNPYVSGIKLPGNQIEDQTFYGEIKSLIGGRAELPCNLTLPSSDDAIQLIFWHRGNNTRVPIYTVDGRASQTLFNATHFLSDIFAPNRAVFDLTTKPSVLRIDPVLETDHSDYRCRVDFRWGRTTNSFVSLHVIVPPKKITIRDQHGNYVHNSTIGPYDQHTDVILTCESNGGVPPPTLQWYKNGVMMDGSYVVGNDGLVSNELTVYKLSSNDLYDKYVCQAGNYNSSNSNPIEAFVVLDINLLPIDVRIITNRSRLIAGRKIEIKCETYGSKPAAIIRWLRNDKLFTHSSETYESNRTTSSITLVPTMMDNQALLKCRAYNPRMLPKGYFTSSFAGSSSPTMSSLPELPKDKYLESVWKLEVLYSPLVQLKIREASDARNQNQESSEVLKPDRKTSPLSPTTTTMVGVHQTKPVMVINAKTSIIIECFVQANPSLVDLQIFHNSTIIQMHKQLDVQYQNVTEFLIDSLNPSHSGRYQCVANNQQGITRSNIIQLDVLYAPFCRNHGLKAQESTSQPADSSPESKSDLPSAMLSMDQYALALNESIKLRCDVDANPKATRFYWTLNSQWLDENHIIAQSDHDDELIYTARSSDSYGNIYCWASNQVGVQQEPCGFSIQKAGPPSPLLGCSVTNKTTTSLTAECFPGDNGGSKQMFHAHIYRSTNNENDDGDADLGDQTDNDDNDNGDGSDLTDPSQMSRIKSKGNQHDKHIGKIDPGSMKSQMNLTSATSPIFYLNNLTPGTSYMIELFAKNDRGHSDAVRLSVTTLFTQNTKLISSSLQEYEYDSWFSVLIGILMTILLAVVAIYVVCHVRQRQISSRNRKKEEQIKQNFAFRPPDTNQSYLNVSDVDTDVVVASAVANTIGNVDKAVVDADDDVVMVGETLQQRRLPPTTTDPKLGSAATNTIKKNKGSKTSPSTTTGTSNMNFGIKKAQQHQPPPEIISFDPTTTTTLESTNSKLSLYVINEEDPSASIPLSNLLNKNNPTHNIVQHHPHHHRAPIFLNPNDPNVSALLQQHAQQQTHPSSQPIQLTTGSLLIGDPLSVAQHPHHHHVQALFGSPFLATTVEPSEHNLHHNLNNGGVNNNNNQQQLTFVTSNQHPCLISSTPTPSGSSMTDTPPPSSQQSLQSHHYFINTPNPHETAATILYTSTIQPQTILSLNNKIDGIVLSSSQNDYYGHPHDGQSMATSSSVTPEAAAILLHHSGQHNQMSSTDEEICDFNLQQTAV